MDRSSTEGPLALYWRKGQRLPGEPPDVEAERQAFAALAEFKLAIKLDVTRPEKNVVAIEFTEMHAS
jgi:hypothetical protein